MVPARLSDHPEERPASGRGGDAGDEDESLSDAFSSVAWQLRRRSMEMLGPWDITPGQSRALGVLMRHGQQRLSDLSDHLHIAARSATEVVDGLESSGLVERRPDPHDRRATLVTLTAKGRNVGTAIRTARAAEAERFFGELSPADRADLARILRLLRDRPTGTDVNAAPSGSPRPGESPRH